MRMYKADSSGNCLQCCLAALFDIPLEDVPPPDVMEVWPGGWFNKLYDWSKINQGCVPVVVLDDTLDELLHIEVVETPLGVEHAVLSYGEHIILDPKTDSGLRELPPAERDTQYRILFVSLAATPQRSEVIMKELIR